MNDLLTILIPTKNRPLLLDRSLSYYAKSKIDVKIIIADSSDKESKNKTKKIFEKYKDILQLFYFHAPENIEPMAKNNLALDFISTPYIFPIGDDDFPLKSSMEIILNNLEKDTSIAAGFGNRVAIKQVSSKNEKLKWVKVYPNYSGISIKNDNPLDRIKRLPIPNWQQYPNAIYRTEVFKKSAEMVSKFEHTQYAEFFSLSMVLVKGKWIKYDLLFAVCHQESKFCNFKDRFLYPHYIGSAGSVLSGVSQDKWSKIVSFLCHKVSKEILNDRASDKTENQTDLALDIRKIYYAKLIYYLESNNKLSNYLIDSNSNILIKLNNFFRKISKFYWLLILYNKSGGILEFVKFAIGFLKELLRGRFLKILFYSNTNHNFLSLLQSIKRTGSLDYESDSLLKKSSKYSDEYKIIFDIWINNPCPQKLNESSLHDK
jgi:glycosyltransferase domain-containing protein